MSTLTWIAIVVVIILIVLIISLILRRRGKNKKSVTVEPKPAPIKIVFITVPQTIKAGSVSAMITIQIQDVNGNPVKVASNIVITLSSSIGGIFSANGNGLPVITTVTVYAGTNSANFYYKDSTKGNPIITASTAGLEPGKQTETIN
jgi:heme/copper-type cytochrome/quinol oxidase subunit 2